MPKKPRKIRIGSSAWSQQKIRDRATYNEQKAAEKPKSKPKQQSTDWQSHWQSHQQSQSQKPKAHYEEPTYTFQSAATIANLRTLGLTAKQNTLAEIKHAYRILALKYHPDKNKEASALGIMKNINVAFAQLIGKDHD
jgi:curved DNA-binding protein CbpA